MQIIEKPIDPEVKQILKIKIKICESEASETQYCLEVIAEVGWLSRVSIKSEYEKCG